MLRIRMSTTRNDTRTKDEEVSQNSREEFIPPPPRTGKNLDAGLSERLQVHLNSARSSEGAWCRALSDKCFSCVGAGPFMSIYWSISVFNQMLKGGREGSTAMGWCGRTWDWQQILQMISGSDGGSTVRLDGTVGQTCFEMPKKISQATKLALLR